MTDTDKSELEKALLGFKGGYGGHSLSSIQVLIQQQCNQARIDELKSLYGPIVELTPVISLDRVNEKLKWGDVTSIISSRIAELQAKETEEA